MAEAGLNLIIQSYIAEKARLQNEIEDLSTQKSLAVASLSDVSQLQNAQTCELRKEWKALYNNDDYDYSENYESYTEIPEFEEALEKIQAIYTEQEEELSSWEEQINTQITVDSGEVTEINAYMESYKSQLSANIQNDFNYGLNS